MVARLMIKRGLTLKNPYAKLVVMGAKPLESRTWHSEYLGPLLITSSKSPDQDAELRLGRTKPEDQGMALGLVTMKGCRPMTREDEDQVLAPWTPGRWVFYFVNPMPIQPFKFKGRLGLFHLTPQEQR